MSRKKNLVQKTTLSALALCCLLTSVSAAQNAEKDNDDEYNLDTVVVTAQRYETREVETPSSMDVYDEERIKLIGADNVQEILKYALGTAYQTYGAGGASLGTMTSDITIRGVANGTLVLVNGQAINGRGLHFLDKIPANSVERIEVIRGGGSVLYGSDAIGGVINIITKKEFPTAFSISGGNYGQFNTTLHVQSNNLGLSYNHREWGKVGNISLSTWRETYENDPTGRYLSQNFRGSKNDNVGVTYKFNDKLNFSYSYDKSSSSWIYEFISGNASAGNKESLAGLPRYDRVYESEQNIAQLNYNNDQGLKAAVFYNDLIMKSSGFNYRTSTGNIDNTPNARSEEKNSNTGLDIQYDWEMNKTKLLAGATMSQETYKNKSTGNDFQRYNYSVYGSADHPFSETVNAILAMRYSWNAGTTSETYSDGRMIRMDNFGKFTPQLQLKKKLDHDQYLYASAGMSYKMPSLNQNVGSASLVVGNPELRPQTGYHYEIGWKKSSGIHHWRFAIFDVTIDDRISTTNTGTSTDPKYRYINEDFKNTGIEIEYSMDRNDRWQYSVGASMGNPKIRNFGRSGNAAVRNGQWERAYDRYQITSGVSYSVNKWLMSLNANYLFGRSHSSPSSAAYGPASEKPALYTSMNIAYKISESKDVSLKIENLLDRKDIANNSSSEYYTTPFNFLVNYNMKF